MVPCERITAALGYCGYCGMQPCVGFDRCPQWDDDGSEWDDGSFGICDECGSPVYPNGPDDFLCEHCYRSMERDDAAAVGGDWHERL